MVALNAGKKWLIYKVYHLLDLRPKVENLLKDVLHYKKTSRSLRSFVCRQQESCMHERRLILAKGRLLTDCVAASIVHSHKELFHLMQGWSFVVHCTYQVSSYSWKEILICLWWKRTLIPCKTGEVRTEVKNNTSLPPRSPPSSVSLANPMQRSHRSTFIYILISASGGRRRIGEGDWFRTKDDLGLALNYFEFTPRDHT